MLFSWLVARAVVDRRRSRDARSGRDGRPARSQPRGHRRAHAVSHAGVDAGADRRHRVARPHGPLDPRRTPPTWATRPSGSTSGRRRRCSSRSSSTRSPGSSATSARTPSNTSSSWGAASVPATRPRSSRPSPRRSVGSSPRRSVGSSSSSGTPWRWALLVWALAAISSLAVHAAVIFTLGGMHVFYDGFIWKLRRPVVAQSLGI